MDTSQSGLLSAGRMMFADFIAPMPVDEFMTEYYGRRPVHIPAGTPSRASLMSWDKLNALLDVQHYWDQDTLSLWKNGKRIAADLYLEDIVVTELQRGKGIGKLLFNASVAEAKRTGCNGMSWQVLEWNTPAIEFYKKFNAAFDAEWVNCSLTGAQVAAYEGAPQRPA